MRLPTDEYQVSLYTNSDNYYSESYSGLVAVTLGHATTGIDVAMEPVVKGTIMGSVREADWAKPIPNIDVCAYDIEQEELFGECTQSNSAGSYELRGLSSGQYLVEFSSPGPGLEYATQYYDKKPNPLYAEPVTVAEGKFTSGIEGSLEKAGDASGEVTSAATGKALKGIDACYYDFAEFLVGCAPTNEKGEYQTPPIAYGEYRVLFASPTESGFDYAMQFYGGFASRFDSPYIDIEAGKLTTGIDAQMASGGSITGDVTSSYSNKSLKDALVCALPGFGEVGSCAVTDASGHYTIEGLDAVEYEVLFEAKGYKWQYYDDVSQPSEARSIAVSAGAISGGVDAAMQPTSGEPPHNPPPNEDGGTPPPAPTVPVPVPVPLIPPASSPASIGAPPSTSSPTISEPSVGTAEQPTPAASIPAASISTSSAAHTYSGAGWSLLGQRRARTLSRGVALVSDRRGNSRKAKHDEARARPPTTQRSSWRGRATEVQARRRRHGAAARPQAHSRDSHRDRASGRCQAGDGQPHDHAEIARVSDALE